MADDCWKRDRKLPACNGQEEEEVLEVREEGAAEKPSADQAPAELGPFYLQALAELRRTEDRLAEVNRQLAELRRVEAHLSAREQSLRIMQENLSKWVQWGKALADWPTVSLPALPPTARPPEEPDF